MSNTIECFNLKNEKVLISQDEIEFRPASYGIIVYNQKILLTIMRSTGKYALPGGGINAGERLEAALTREVYEECGIEVEVGKLAHFEERNFYYDPWDKAWQVFAFLYFCKPLTVELSDQYNEADDESIKPQWVEIKALKADQFQVFGEKVMEILQKFNHSKPVDYFFSG